MGSSTVNLFYIGNLHITKPPSMKNIYIYIFIIAIFFKHNFKSKIQKS